MYSMATRTTKLQEIPALDDFHYFRFVTQLNNFSDSSSCSLKKDGDHLVCVKHCSIHMDSPAVFI